MASIDTSASIQSSSETSQGFASLSSEEFTEIILTELSNQDPLEPNDTQALLEQLSAIRSIESDTRLTDALDSLVDRDEFATAASLIGREVTGLDSVGETSTDAVRSVSQSSDGVLLNLVGGRTMRFSDITEVREVVAAPGDGSGSEDPSDPDDAAEDGGDS
ncbi:MAG: flagellar hook capping FlgD N-terminal domain-containing protein [Planctomycetota bacterium]